MNRLSAMPVKLGAMALMLLMAATRFDHFGSAIALPDASLVVFFLAGLWFSAPGFLLALLVEAVLIDYVAIKYLAVSDFCISSAYGFMLVAYAVVWLAGLFSQRYSQLSLTNAVKQFGLLIGSVSSAFVISNSSFYLLSDKVAVHSWAIYTAQFSQYYSAYVSSALIYGVLIVAVVHIANRLLADKTDHSLV